MSTTRTYSITASFLPFEIIEIAHRVTWFRVGLLVVNLALGLFARQQQHATIDYAIDIFDSAFISTNYVHSAQMSFQHYVDNRIAAAGPADLSKANALLEKVPDEIDVAIERSTSARSRELGGTGLGLSIVKHLAQAFGGQVALTSRPGEGSTFQIRLPHA